MAGTIPTQEEVLGYFESLSNWGRWGADDQLGTLNLITPSDDEAGRSASAGRSHHWLRSVHPK